MMKIHRLIACYIDLAAVTLINIPFFLLHIMLKKPLTLALLAVCFISCFLLKDALGINVGKRLFKIKIYQCDCDLGATKKQKILRNITLLVWPVEAIVLLASKDDKRLGDRLAHTIVGAAGRS